ncbi:DinB family protein [Taibaiella chishuiensis]|uniref:DinB family protein n=2 Tax=Taibaiella chishuiensis TaxID=1434707 RepID=A0A2P8D324_9BACT|nr:DinB family protein [Taibaiella chishuiensis]
MGLQNTNYNQNMTISEAIASHLLDVFFGESWTDVWIFHTLEDLDWKEAIQPTAGSPNTIASLLHHITFYNKVIQQRLQGTDPVIGEANGFDLPPVHNAEDWIWMKTLNLQSATDLAEMIRQLPDTVLHQSIGNVPGASSYYKQLHGVIEHAYYHLGQIVILKNLIRKQQQ